MNRRAFLMSTAGLAMLSAGKGAMAAGDPNKQFAAIETAAKGRLGVAVLDTATGRTLAYRGEERFPLLSTWKALASGCVLARVDSGKDALDRRITYSQASVLSYAPVTKHHVSDGMTLGELCAAALELSDNTAANLLLDTIGGPKGLTAWLRSIGDTVSRLDRTEPTLNEARPGDPRDTTTPRAIADTLNTLLLGTVLSPASRRQLTDWMIACKTGASRLRAGLPPDWRVGDKTGTNDTGANDIAIAWPTGRAPLIIACYLADTNVPLAERDAAIANVAKVAVSRAT